MHTFKKTQKPGSLIHLEGTIDAATIEQYLPKARTQLKKQIAVDGFREGSIPDAMLEAKLGKGRIYDTAAEYCLHELLPGILIEHAVMPITAPEVSVHTHDGKEAHVTIVATIYPAVTLPDYKAEARALNAEKKDAAVTEEDIANALIHFRRERVRVESLDQGSTPEAAIEAAELTTPDALPQLDAAFLSQIGFKDEADFEASIRKNLQTSKTDRVRSEHRAKILKAITDKTTADTPDALIEYELAKMEASLAEYLSQAGMTLDAYRAQSKKTREEIHAEWRPDASVRAKTQLALIEIGKIESIIEDKKELDALVNSVMSSAKDADENAVHAHYATILRNEKVLSFLESTI